MPPKSSSSKKYLSTSTPEEKVVHRDEETIPVHDGTGSVRSSSQATSSSQQSRMSRSTRSNQSGQSLSGSRSLRDAGISSQLEQQQQFSSVTTTPTAGGRVTQHLPPLQPTSSGSKEDLSVLATSGSQNLSSSALLLGGSLKERTPSSGSNLLHPQHSLTRNSSSSVMSRSPSPSETNLLSAPNILTHPSRLAPLGGSLNSSPPTLIPRNSSSSLAASAHSSRRQSPGESPRGTDVPPVLQGTPIENSSSQTLSPTTVLGSSSHIRPSPSNDHLLQQQQQQNSMNSSSIQTPSGIQLVEPEGSVGAGSNSNSFYNGSSSSGTALGKLGILPSSTMQQQQQQSMMNQSITSNFSGKESSLGKGSVFSSDTRRSGLSSGYHVSTSSQRSGGTFASPTTSTTTAGGGGGGGEAYLPPVLSPGGVRSPKAQYGRGNSPASAASQSDGEDATYEKLHRYRDEEVPLVESRRQSGERSYGSSLPVSRAGSQGNLLSGGGGTSSGGPSSKHSSTENMILVAGGGRQNSSSLSSQRTTAEGQPYPIGVTAEMGTQTDYVKVVQPTTTTGGGASFNALRRYKSRDTLNDDASDYPDSVTATQIPDDVTERESIYSTRAPSQKSGKEGGGDSRLSPKRSAGPNTFPVFEVPPNHTGDMQVFNPVGRPHRRRTSGSRITTEEEVSPALSEGESSSQVTPNPNSSSAEVSLETSFQDGRGGGGESTTPPIDALNQIPGPLGRISSMHSVSSRNKPTGKGKPLTSALKSAPGSTKDSIKNSSAKVKIKERHHQQEQEQSPVKKLQKGSTQSTPAPDEVLMTRTQWEQYFLAQQQHQQVDHHSHASPLRKGSTNQHVEEGRRGSKKEPPSQQQGDQSNPYLSLPGYHDNDDAMSMASTTKIALHQPALLMTIDNPEQASAMVTGKNSEHSSSTGTGTGTASGGGTGTGSHSSPTHTISPTTTTSGGGQPTPTTTTSGDQTQNNNGPASPRAIHNAITQQQQQADGQILAMESSGIRATNLIGKSAVKMGWTGSRKASSLNPYVCAIALRSFQLTSHEESICVPVQIKGAILFIDMSGYSAISTALESKGAFALFNAVNSYLVKILEVVAMFGGEVIKFAGDAVITLWYGSNQMKNVQGASHCALYLLRHLPSHPVSGTDLTFGIHIGLTCGMIDSQVFRSHTVRNMQNHFHMISGEPMRQIGAVVSAAKRGEVCCSQEVLQYLCPTIMASERKGTTGALRKDAVITSLNHSMTTSTAGGGTISPTAATVISAGSRSPGAGGMSLTAGGRSSSLSTNSSSLQGGRPVSASRKDPTMGTILSPPSHASISPATALLHPRVGSGQSGRRGSTALSHQEAPLISQVPPLPGDSLEDSQDATTSLQDHHSSSSGVSGGVLVFPHPRPSSAAPVPGAPGSVMDTSSTGMSVSVSSLASVNLCDIFLLRETVLCTPKDLRSLVGVSASPTKEQQQKNGDEEDGETGGGLTHRSDCTLPPAEAGGAGVETTTSPRGIHSSASPLAPSPPTAVASADECNCGTMRRILLGPDADEMDSVMSDLDSMDGEEEDWEEDADHREENLEKFLHPSVRRRLKQGLLQSQMAEMRLLTILFIHKTNQNTDVEDWFSEVQRVIDEYHCPIIQLIDDDKGVHIVAAINLFFADREPAVTGLRLAKALVNRQAGCTVGIASGMTFCGVVGSHRASRWDVTGWVCVRACRLMEWGVANSEPVVVGQSVLQYAGDDSLTVPCGEILIKGTPEPIKIFKLNDVDTKILSSITSATRFCTNVHSQQHEVLRQEVIEKNHQRHATVMYGGSGSGKTFLCVRSVFQTGIVPLVHVAVENSQQLDAAHTIANWFSYHKDPEIGALASRILQSYKLEHFIQTSSLALELVKLTIVKGIKTAFIVKQSQCLDSMSLSFLRQTVEDSKSKGSGRWLLFLTLVPQHGVSSWSGLKSTFRKSGSNSLTLLHVGGLPEEEAHALIEHRFGWKVTKELSRATQEITGRMAGCINDVIAYLQGRGKSFIKTQLENGGTIHIPREQLLKYRSLRWSVISPSICAKSGQLLDALTPSAKIILKVMAGLHTHFNPVSRSLIVSVTTRVLTNASPASVRKDLQLLLDLNMLVSKQSRIMEASQAAFGEETVDDDDGGVAFEFANPSLLDVVLGVTLSQQIKQVCQIAATFATEAERDINPPEYFFSMGHYQFQAGALSKYKSSIAKGIQKVLGVNESVSSPFSSSYRAAGSPAGSPRALRPTSAARRGSSRTFSVGFSTDAASVVEATDVPEGEEEDQEMEGETVAKRVYSDHERYLLLRKVALDLHEKGVEPEDCGLNAEQLAYLATEVRSSASAAAVNEEDHSSTPRLSPRTQTKTRTMPEAIVRCRDFTPPLSLGFMTMTLRTTAALFCKLAVANSGGTGVAPIKQEEVENLLKLATNYNKFGKQVDRAVGATCPLGHEELDLWKRWLVVEPQQMTSNKERDEEDPSALTTTVVNSLHDLPFEVVVANAQEFLDYVDTTVKHRVDAVHCYLRNKMQVPTKPDQPFWDGSERDALHQAMQHTLDKWSENDVTALRDGLMEMATQGWLPRNPDLTIEFQRDCYLRKRIQPTFCFLSFLFVNLTLSLAAE